MRLAVRSADSAKDWPRRSSTVSRQISTPAEASSIRLSKPKASSVIEPATMPAPIATAASMTIHARVAYSTKNACRTRSRRPSDTVAGRSPSAIELDLGLAKPEEICRRGRNRPVDGEDRDLEFLARSDGVAQHQAIGHIEALDRGRAGPAGRPRHLAIDPDFSVIVDVHRQHRFRAGSVETCGIGRYCQGRAEPEERDHAAAPLGAQIRR